MSTTTERPSAPRSDRHRSTKPRRNPSRLPIRGRTAEQLAGQVLGKVRLERILGEGAVGVVYLGTHLTLDAKVAVKVLKNRESTRDQRYRERFRNEARLAARIDHPGVVRVIDFGEEDGRAYLVMEYIEGFTLETYLAKRGSAGVTTVNALRLLTAAALALQAAHDVGVTHRDLKPGNLLLTRKGMLKIADLGLARFDDEPGLTRDNVILGSPAYMAPECVSPGTPVDHRCDLYALGVIAYQMLFGILPYRGTVKEILHGHMAGSARFDLPTQASPETVALVRDLMATDPKARPDSCAELVQRLRNCLALEQRTGPAQEATTRQVRKRAAIPRGEGSTAARSAVTTTGSTKSTTSVGEFSGIVRFLDDTVSTHGDAVIVHSTGRERLVVVLLLVVVLVVAAAGLAVGLPAILDEERTAAPATPQSAMEPPAAAGQPMPQSDAEPPPATDRIDGEPTPPPRSAADAVVDEVQQRID